ncbi:uncharacterized protein LOC117294432 isoform X2 [Asterias rubens]|uniref:uncharacterized protein LOC117294432 isoform X2 n=1 Tax=Asterias rubens TaxID=7604 RepID=UPI001454F196|nr:uncharacterized protein LOC117294432 isoform X2 [Asterias rubens]
MSDQAKPAATGRKSRPRKRKTSVPLPGPWRNSSWVSSFGGKGASPIKYQEVSPSFLLRQLLVLIEKGKFVDASQLLNKISIESLKEIVLDIPVDPVIDSVPQSLVFLESLYSRLFLSDVESFPVEQFQVEAMVFHIVRYISMVQSAIEFKYPKPEEARKSIHNILRIVLHINPDLVRTLFKRKKLMDTALQGIGEHGFIPMNGSLIDLHDGLKFEINKNIQAFKAAVNTLDHLNLSHSKPVKLKINSDKKSSQGNHQALTKLNENQIKNRLYKNKSLLNAIELRTNSQLPSLIKTLKDRIEYDKSALLAFGKLKTEIKTFSSNAKVVPLIAQYSKSLQTVLDIFKELLDEHCSSDQSSYSTLGYHSDEEDIISLHREDEDTEEEPTKEEVVVVEIEVQQEMVTVAKKEGPLIEQIFAPTTNHHEKSAMPGEQPTEKRSRWWKHHKRSHSLELSPSTQAAVSNSSNEAEQTKPSRSSSMDPIVISRPRRESVEESAELQQMLTRIRKMSASSPAVGRRQLEKRGISQPRSRDSSVSPSVLRKHYFGGGEKTPSISSQMDDAIDNDADPTYATLKFKTPPQSSSKDKDSTKAESSSEATNSDPLYAKIKVKGKGSKAKDDDTLFTLPPDLEQLDPTQLAKIEAELNLENERLIKRLQRNSIEMQKLKDAQEKAVSKGAHPTPALKEDKSPVIIPRRESSNTELFPTDQGEPSSEEGKLSETSPTLRPPDEFTDRRSSSPSFVEQQVAVLEKQKAESVIPSVPKKSLWKLEESSVQERRESFEKQLVSMSEEAAPEKANLQSLKEGEEKPAEIKSVKIVEKLAETRYGKIVDSAETPQKEASELKDRVAKGSKPAEEKSVKTVGSANPRQIEATELEDREPKDSIVDAQPGQDDKPVPVAQQESAAKVVVQHVEPSKEKQQAVIPPAESQTNPSLGNTSPKNGPTKTNGSIKTVLKQEAPVNNNIKSEVTKKVQVKNPPAEEVEASAIPNGLQPAAVEQASSPALQPKSASLIKQKGTGSHQRSQQTANKSTPINRHLPKHHIRHITGDLLYAYDKLYSEQRAIAWTGLSIDPQKKDAVLFSVIVFAFRSAQITIHELHMAKARMQQLPTDDEESVSSYTIDIPPNNKSQVELLQHLRKMANTFDLSPMIADVLDQVYDLSEDNATLEGSTPLKKFVTSCVSIAWKLSIQSSPYVIDFELRSFDPSVHQRTSSSSRRSPKIKEHLWPALLESSKGMVVYKGVVVT